MAYAPSEDSEQPGHPPSLIRVFAVRIKKAWVLSYPLSAQRRLWSDWADAQADPSPRWAHSHFVGFVTRRLILKTAELKGTCLPFLIDFYPGIPTTHSFRHLSRHYENSGHVSCRVKKIHAMVKVDNWDICFFDFWHVMRTFENGILCFNVFCISVII